jgi:predicted AAA+ superfamily ATPase
MYERLLLARVKRDLARSPAVALLGPRQCGKSTLARELLSPSAYLDLERPSDRARLADPELYFDNHPAGLVCLDEIQRVPELFPALRSILDERRPRRQVLLLGSASPELIRGAAESLAGRVLFRELSPFLVQEVPSVDRLWLRGGFPRSYLARSEGDSLEWRRSFTQAFLERDIPQLGIRVPAENLRRLWTMLAHRHAQLANYSELGQALGLSHNTIRSYVDLLCGAYVVRQLPPFLANVEKRLVRSPKIYVRDSGIVHALLDLRTRDDLLGHPVVGASWEGFVIENLIHLGTARNSGFYRTSSGAEIDWVVETAKGRFAVECKASTSPTLSAGFWHACDDLGIKRAWVVAPVKERYELRRGVSVLPLEEAVMEIPKAAGLAIA